ncbi:MAG TPA: hypothetical protein VNU01_05835 [Egibacteraceae bacterium]|nr:hypothetical protein [Egibacteraceae bacterium]
MAVALLLAVLTLLPNGVQADLLDGAGLELPALSEVSSGWMHSCGLGQDGKVYCWGNNATGNLGDGTAANARPLAKRVDGMDAPAIQVSSGADHSCALTTNGDAWCWGGNLSGQLGVNSDTLVLRRQPGKVVDGYRGIALPRFVQISAGGSHSCALAENGVPWCWGANDVGQLGSTPPSAILPDDGGDARPVWTSQMGTATKIIAGAAHTCAINTVSELWCWGDNGAGQLGVNSKQEAWSPVRVHATGGFPDGGVATVALGTTHTCASTRNGNAYCWGDNSYGRIGSTSPTSDTAQGPDSLVPQKVRPYPGSRAETGIGGNANMRFADLMGVSAGLDHSCAWTRTGVGWCWGRAAYGHLGDGTVSASQPKPRFQVVEYTLQFVDTGAIQHISAGYNHTCSLNANGRAHCWGHNGFGQVGDGTFVFHHRPAKVLQLDAPV